jgi:hypothetical protein
VLNWNEQAMEFYQELGAVPMDEWTTFRLTGEALERLASFGGRGPQGELPPMKPATTEDARTGTAVPEHGTARAGAAVRERGNA